MMSHKREVINEGQEITLERGPTKNMTRQQSKDASKIRFLENPGFGRLDEERKITDPKDPDNLRFQDMNPRIGKDPNPKKGGKWLKKDLGSSGHESFGSMGFECHKSAVTKNNSRRGLFAVNFCGCGGPEDDADDRQAIINPSSGMDDGEAGSDSPARSHKMDDNCHKNISDLSCILGLIGAASFLVLVACLTAAALAYPWGGTTTSFTNSSSPPPTVDFSPPWRADDDAPLVKEHDRNVHPKDKAPEVDEVEPVVKDPKTYHKEGSSFHVEASNKPGRSIDETSVSVSKDEAKNVGKEAKKSQPHFLEKVFGKKGFMLLRLLMVLNLSAKKRSGNDAIEKS